MNDEALRFCSELRDELNEEEKIYFILRDGDVVSKLFLLAVMKEEVTSLYFCFFAFSKIFLF